MASLLLLIKTRCLSQHEHNTVLHCVCIAINQRVIVKINNRLCAMFRNHNGYVMAMVHTMQQLSDEIHDVLYSDNFIMKTDVNLIVKNH